jgi:hypothetical protein
VGEDFACRPQLGFRMLPTDMPPEYDEWGPPWRGPRVGEMCVQHVVESGVSGVSGVYTSVTGAYMCTHRIDVHEATHKCFLFSLFDSYLKFAISISPS